MYARSSSRYEWEKSSLSQVCPSTGISRTGCWLQTCDLRFLHGLGCFYYGREIVLDLRCFPGGSPGGIYKGNIPYPSLDRISEWEADCGLSPWLMNIHSHPVGNCSRRPRSRKRGGNHGRAGCPVIYFSSCKLAEWSIGHDMETSWSSHPSSASTIKIASKWSLCT
jgi:hypothetical protein